MNVNLTGIKYMIDGNTGVTQSIQVTLGGYGTNESTTTTANITDGDLDNMSRAEIEAAGRKRAESFFTVTQPDNSTVADSSAASSATSSAENKD